MEKLKQSQKMNLRPTISCMAPERKDSVSVICDGTKVKEQRRYLPMTIREAYHLYHDESADD